MTKILIADDDPGLRDILNYALRKQGWDVCEAHDGKAALAAFEQESPDLIVLDVMMPEMDGVEVCRQIRRDDSKVPIVFLSALDEEIDRVLGLEMGGDDYITKPFSPRELTARIKGMLRRLDWVAEPGADHAPLTHGRLTLDPTTHRVTFDGQEAVLTVTEFGLLRSLMARPGEVMGRDELMQTAYDLGRIVSDRTIDSHIRRVRRKLGGDGDDSPVVETVRGRGYKLGPC
ncbi:MAG: response regulator transcription factor [Alphaproteobacteria bacterium]